MEYWLTPEEQRCAVGGFMDSLYGADNMAQWQEVKQLIGVTSERQMMSTVLTCMNKLYKSPIADFISNREQEPEFVSHWTEVKSKAGISQDGELVVMLLELCEQVHQIHCVSDMLAADEDMDSRFTGG